MFSPTRLLLAGVALSLATTAAANEPAALIINPDGTPGFATGDLGTVTPPANQGYDLGSFARQAINNDGIFSADVQRFVTDYAQLNLDATGRENLTQTATAVDGAGTTHVRFDQSINGISVVGANLVVHLETQTGQIYAVNGDFVSATGLSTRAAMKWQTALRTAIADAQITSASLKRGGKLVYLMDPETNGAQLAWEAIVAYSKDGLDHIDKIFADAATGAHLASHALRHPIRVLRTHDAQATVTLPGDLVCTDDETCNTDVAQTAHDNASIMYDYLNERFDRDSYDNDGIAIVSTVNYRNDANEPMNNAFFSSSRQQMVYGEGDGVRFGPLGNAADVVAHELGHGVTNSESQLIYQNESGALNEAWSDIIAAGAEAWRDGSVSDRTWMLGEDIFTPGVNGDALRYMNDPTQDRTSPSSEIFSRDFYPDRYQGALDRGGVHLNSGIANLAFQLLVDGGTHPRDRSDITVAGIGMERAEQIFYRAQTTYLTSSSNFEAARVATWQSAMDLYDKTVANEVDLAWCAVGVPGCRSNPDPVGETCQASTVSVDNVSANFWGGWRDKRDVPDCATRITVTISGGTGNADLYVRVNGRATKSNYDCRDTGDGNSHTCVVNNPDGGEVSVLVNAKSFSFKNVDYRLRIE